MTAARPIVVASNRGPVTFVRHDDGAVEAKRGVGGLVTAVGGAVRGHDATWISAAISEEDRRRAGPGAPPHELPAAGGSIHVRMLAPDLDDYDSFYNQISNRILWFLHHYLWDAAGTPDFGDEHEAWWQSFRAVNDAFAAGVAEALPADGIALPQDYHLSLVPGALRRHGANAPIAFFWHIPFCQPDQFRLLPDRWGTELLRESLVADVVGFHSPRWARNFLECCAAVLGARVHRRVVHFEGRRTAVRAYPIGVDVDTLARASESAEVDAALAALDRVVGDRLLVLRADRTELTKNILRGLSAFGRLLERRPDLRDRVVHVARLSPSRAGVPEYEEYMERCKQQAGAVNERFGSETWTPIVMDVDNDFVKTLAAYRRYDVLIVNPVYDGMNLVAREGPLVNERDGVLVLSRNAGAADELGSAALLVNPFDVTGTVDALEQAIDMAAGERRARAEQLRPLAAGTHPARWIEAQIRDAQKMRGA
ncbi:MAG TPA: trehalose-6-phosphate synthase [Actinomycetota bacterium]